MTKEELAAIKARRAIKEGWLGGWSYESGGEGMPGMVADIDSLVAEVERSAAKIATLEKEIAEHAEWARSQMTNPESAAFKIILEENAALKKWQQKAGFTISLLRGALIGLVGTEDVEKLKAMEAAVLILPILSEDIARSIAAIRALIKTSAALTTEPE